MDRNDHINYFISSYFSISEFVIILYDKQNRLKIGNLIKVVNNTL